MLETSFFEPVLKFPITVGPNLYVSGLKIEVENFNFDVEKSNLEYKLKTTCMLLIKWIPLSPIERIHFTNYQFVRCILPLFQLYKFNGIHIIRKTKKLN